LTFNSFAGKLIPEAGWTMVPLLLTSTVTFWAETRSVLRRAMAGMASHASKRWGMVGRFIGFNLLSSRCPDSIQAKATVIIY
jgi:hypothetical protein